VLWTINAYLIAERKNYWVTLVPATFMTTVVVSYLLLAPEGLRLQNDISYLISLVVAFGLTTMTMFYIYKSRINKELVP
jgi:branched-subunit amino acid transport protein